jgi:hypothetical protein
MGKTKIYQLTDVEFRGKAYKSLKTRKIINHTNCGVLILPTWMIGKEFDFILIPKNETNKEENKTD